MSFRQHRLKLFLLSLLALPLAAGALPRYSVNVLAGAGSNALDINLGGQVVGTYMDSSGNIAAFVHSGAGPLDLGTLGGATATAKAINDSGVIAGYSADASGAPKAFVYSSGMMTSLGTLGGNFSAAHGINNAGVIVGGATAAEGEVGQFGHAFRYISSMQDIGTLPGSDEFSEAFAINSAGQIVGHGTVEGSGPPEHETHAFLYSGGIMTDLGTLGGLYSTAEAINDGGWIVGDASTDIEFESGHAVRHAYLRVGGVMIDLGVFGGMFAGSGAFDVNNLGQVVGWSDTGADSGSNPHGFLYQGGALVDLNLLIDPLTGWTITAAQAINDLQQIAGTACRGGECFAVRLDLLGAAVPEPGTVVLLAMGIAMLGLTARIRRRSSCSADELPAT